MICKLNWIYKLSSKFFNFSKRKHKFSAIINTPRMHIVDSNTRTVFSSCNINGDKLSYFAELNIHTHDLSLKLFDQKGKLKTQRSLTFPSKITSIFPADKYIIGFTHNQLRVCLFDINRYVNPLAYGFVPNEDHLHERMKKEKLEFFSFIYNY
jgi:hypothetical protein